MRATPLGRRAPGAAFFACLAGICKPRPWMKKPPMPHSPRQKFPPGILFLLVGLTVATMGMGLSIDAPLAQGKGSTEEDRSNETLIEPAIISIQVTHQRGDWFSPWQRTRPSKSSGSGFLIAGGRIMTNANVVSDAKQIVVRRNEGKRPFFAEVEFIAHDSDLAVLKVKNPAFAKGVRPLEIGPLPSLRSRVRTYGYPAGGEKISRTEGVVSRIQFITYLHPGADSHLAVQTDSAINPGNSGGPVIQEGKVIGVAFQANTRLNDVGYFIPAPVINRFLSDIKDGTYDGYGDLGALTSNLMNPVFRDFLQLPDAETGVVVDRLLPGASGASFIFPNDVIMAVDGIPVLSDGTIKFRGYSLNYIQVVEEKQIGEQVRLTVWRDGKTVEVKFPLQKLPDAERMRSQFDTSPSYVVYAGLVFMKLDQEYLKTFGNYWEHADKHLLYRQFFFSYENSAKSIERIVISRVLPHPINSAYVGMVNYFVTSINGVPIERLGDVLKGFKASRKGFHRILLDPGERILVLNAKLAERAHPVILKRYGIRQAWRLP